MSECKHGLRSGCAYCHAPRQSAPTRPQAGQPRKRASSSTLSDKMNDRMTALKKRLREIRGG
jgi:hypothetical protein